MSLLSAILIYSKGMRDISVGVAVFEDVKVRFLGVCVCLQMYYTSLVIGR